MIQNQRSYLNSGETVRQIAYILAFLLGASSIAHAQNRTETYSVVGIAQNDSLHVRSSPGEKFSIVAKLRNGTTGIRLAGQSVMNGSDDWVPIMVSGVKGWVRPKYLAPSSGLTAKRAANEPAVISADLPAVDLSIPSDWRPHSREWTRAYGAAANGDVDEGRRRVARGEGTVDDVRYGWADYLYQQQRIRTWTPVFIGAGIAVAVALLNNDLGTSSIESPRRDVNTPSEIDYERRRQQEIDRRIDESRR